MENNYILIRYGEISLKRGKKSFFEKILQENIKSALSNNIILFKKYPGRFVIKVKNLDLALKKLNKIFGIKSYSPAYYINIDWSKKDLKYLAEIIKKNFLDKIKNKRFKVECNRVGSHNFTSYDVVKTVGAELSKYGIVDIKNPEYVIYIEIREKDVYIYNIIYPGVGGFPLGSENRLLAFISGGFDSPVAAWYLMRRGAKVDIITYNIGGDIFKYYILKVIKNLLGWAIGYNTKIYIVDSKKLVENIHTKIDSRLWMLAFKILSYKFAENLAKTINAYGFITGESLGQKASQTLENMYAVSRLVEYPIYRPLIGMDKDEIIKKAMFIGTYNTCELLPEFAKIFSKNPETKADPLEVEQIYKALKDVLKELKVEYLEKKSLKNYLTNLESKIKEYFIINIDHFRILKNKFEEIKYIKIKTKDDLNNIGIKMFKENPNCLYIIYSELGSDCYEYVKNIKKNYNLSNIYASFEKIVNRIKKLDN